MNKKKTLIVRILNLNGTWQGYKLITPHAYDKATWPEPGKQFDTLTKIITIPFLLQLPYLHTLINYYKCMFEI